MHHSLSLLVLPMLAAATAVQHPLADSTVQAPINRKPLVDSNTLQSLMKSENLLKRAKHLYQIAELSVEEYGHPTRVIGSEGHMGTISYIIRTLTDLGDYYEISNQTFDAMAGSIFEFRLVLGDGQPKSTRPMSYTPPTKNRQAEFGDLVLVENDGCDSSDYPSHVDGNIALIRRGSCSFGDKSTAAGKAGAIAAVIYNTDDGTLNGQLGTPNKHHVATFGISKSDAKPFIKALKDGREIKSSAYMDAIVRQVSTTNVIAQTKGGDQENCVMLGGHSDSVDAGPGINDDGSGSLTLLEIASHLVNYEVNNCVRFAWWAGEEEGLLGSDYYVSQLSEEENLKIRLFMDYDMLASPNYAYQVYNATNAANPDGSEELRDLYTAWYKSQGLHYMYIPFDGRSDYDAFIKHGIPGGGIATGAEGVKTKLEQIMFGGKAGQWYDPCYHQLCDGVENCDLVAWEINAKLVSHTVATYANSLKGFPKRTGIKSAAVEEPHMYHGPYLVM